MLALTETPKPEFTADEILTSLCALILYYEEHYYPPWRNRRDHRALAIALSLALAGDYGEGILHARLDHMSR